MTSKFELGVARMLMLACDADARADVCSAARVYAEVVPVGDAAILYAECIDKLDELERK